MKVLWITNTVFPVPAEILKIPKPVFGGWMYGLADNLSKEPDIELAIATTYNGSEVQNIQIDGISYYLLPCKNPLKYQHKLEIYWNDVCSLFLPDIVHIHGTEYPSALACMIKRPFLKYIISIQGILSVYERYYFGGMTNLEIFKSITFRDIVRMDTLFQARNKMIKCSRLETLYFEKTKHLIGRTSWDKVHSSVLGKNAQYHFCNESLRQSFYEAEKWDINNCRKYSIFISQASYPLKGLHIVLKALAILKPEFPQIHLSIAGPDITRGAGWKDRFFRTGYGCYIRQIISKNKLWPAIEFTGELQEEKMISAYLNANVFVCPSMIENSPNSLGEAQLLGIPYVAAYVGGIPDMVGQVAKGILYRFEEVEMLADNIRSIFNSPQKAELFSQSGILLAKKRHDHLLNLYKLKEIYEEVLYKN